MAQSSEEVLVALTARVEQLESTVAMLVQHARLNAQVSNTAQVKDVVKNEAAKTAEVVKVDNRDVRGFAPLGGVRSGLRG